MAQNVTVAGASYSDVPGVNLPKTGGGTAYFTDVTDTTATASDVASGKYFYTAAGTKTQGTATIGGTISIVDTTDSHGGTIRTITAEALSLQEKSNINPTTSSQTITPDNGYNGLSSVQINAMPTGSATAPATISGTSATVSTGTNTLTLTKTVSVTPSVTAGYIASGTAGNASVSLTANVTTQAAQTIHPSTSDQTIANGRYLTGTQTIKAVTLSNLTADNIKNGVTVKVGDGTDDDCVASVTGTYSGDGGGKAAQIAPGFGRTNQTAYTAITGQSITVAKTGKYHVYWEGYRTSTGGTNGSCLYIDGSAHSSGNQTSFDSSYINCQAVHLTNVSLTKDQVITVRARARSTNYYMYIFALTIIEA